MRSFLALWLLAFVALLGATAVGVGVLYLLVKLALLLEAYTGFAGAAFALVVAILLVASGILAAVSHYVRTH